MKHLRAINKKALRVDQHVAAKRNEAQFREEAETNDVFALQQGPNNSRSQSAPHYPTGCTIVFSPGWEVDSSGGTAGLCQPAERDLYDCYATCFWPAQVPDHLNNYPDWTKQCAAATKDWRNIELVFP